MLDGVDDCAGEGVRGGEFGGDAAAGGVGAGRVEVDGVEGLVGFYGFFVYFGG